MDHISDLILRLLAGRGAVEKFQFQRLERDHYASLARFEAGRREADAKAASSAAKKNKTRKDSTPSQGRVPSLTRTDTLDTDECDNRVPDVLPDAPSSTSLVSSQRQRRCPRTPVSKTYAEIHGSVATNDNYDTEYGKNAPVRLFPIPPIPPMEGVGRFRRSVNASVEWKRRMVFEDPARLDLWPSEHAIMNPATPTVLKCRKPSNNSSASNQGVTEVALDQQDGSIIIRGGFNSRQTSYGSWAREMTNLQDQIRKESGTGVKDNHGAISPPGVSTTTATTISTRSPISGNDRREAAHVADLRACFRLHPPSLQAEPPIFPTNVTKSNGANHKNTHVQLVQPKEGPSGSVSSSEQDDVPSVLLREPAPKQVSNEQNNTFLPLLNHPARMMMEHENPNSFIDDSQAEMERFKRQRRRIQTGLTTTMKPVEKDLCYA